MYRPAPAAHNRLASRHGARPFDIALQELVPPPDIEERGVALRPRTWKLPVALRRWRDDERGAEMVEFAFVVVLLVMLLYGIITYGLILAAQATVTQAAADGARSGIVAGSSAAAEHAATRPRRAQTSAGWEGWMWQSRTVLTDDHHLSQSPNRVPRTPTTRA